MKQEEDIWFEIWILLYYHWMSVCIVFDLHFHIYVEMNTWIYFFLQIEIDIEPTDKVSLDWYFMPKYYKTDKCLNQYGSMKQYTKLLLYILTFVRKPLSFMFNSASKSPYYGKKYEKWSLCAVSPYSLLVTQ